MSDGLPTTDDYTFPWYVYYSLSLDKVVCRVDFGLAKELQSNAAASREFRYAVYQQILNRASSKQYCKSMLRDGCVWVVR